MSKCLQLQKWDKTTHLINRWKFYLYIYFEKHVTFNSERFYTFNYRTHFILYWIVCQQSSSVLQMFSKEWRPALERVDDFRDQTRHVVSRLDPRWVPELQWAPPPMTYCTELTSQCVFSGCMTDRPATAKCLWVGPDHTFYKDCSSLWCNIMM